jgi:hypothetical protein
VDIHDGFFLKDKISTEAEHACPFCKRTEGF